MTFFPLGFVNQNASREAGLVYVQSAAPWVENLLVRSFWPECDGRSKKQNLPRVLACMKQGRQSVVPKKRPGQTIERVRDAKISRPLRTHGQTEAYRCGRAHFHHPLCAAAHDRLSIRCGAGKTPGQKLHPPQRSSASMSFSWLFLGGVVSTSARLRFTNRGQCAVNSVCRSRNSQRTANYLLTVCLTPGGKRTAELLVELRDWTSNRKTDMASCRGEARSDAEPRKTPDPRERNLQERSLQTRRLDRGEHPVTAL
jgi:hypothetical protein